MPVLLFLFTYLFIYLLNLCTPELLNNELDRIWKEALIRYGTTQNPRKLELGMASVPTEVTTGDISNIS
jgi:hypothetical protein